MPSYDFRARVGLTRSQGVANLLYTLCAPDVSFQRGFLIYVKIRADLQSKKFHFSTIYPAKFGINNNWKKIGHLELVPPSISPFLVLPSIRRYRIECLALYAVLATKYLFHTHNCYQMVHPNDQNPQNLGTWAPGAEGIVRVGKLKLTFQCFFCVCAKYLWPRETIAPVVRVSRFFLGWRNVSQVLFIFYINY